jgi:ABC-type amino acid transport substrate-binding protein
VKYFSLPLVGIVGASLVRKGDARLTLAQIRAIAVPRGFTPDHLLAVQAEHNFELVETSDANAALQMLLKNRVDAADVEWHVARHLLGKTGRAAQVEIAQQLPVTSVAFHLSSNRHGDLLRRFDRFLLENAEAIQRLQQKYQIQSVNELISPIQAASVSDAESGTAVLE